jgi:redox-sensitive bicupin YhaK (pirin superfamily)
MPHPVELSITPSPRDLGDFEVRRALPSSRRRSVGPFVFWDEMGPAHFAPGTGLDVRPHPHIGLATLTYLFEGEIMHRDSLGTEQTIVPGDVNLMTAGRGIVHSERSPMTRRGERHQLHGIQAWLALPREDEESAPGFVHYPAAALPTIEGEGTSVRVIAGSLFDHSSPVALSTPTLMVEARIDVGARLVLGAEHAERALYVVAGSLDVGAQPQPAGTLAVLASGVDTEITAISSSHFLVLGGAPPDGERRLWWNFVASDQARIDAAKAAWEDSISRGFIGTPFTLPPAESEHIPLPEQVSGPPEPSRECPTT